jgi:hypothetical protein
VDLINIKNKNEAILKAKGIKVNPNLPTIEVLPEVNPRSASDVAKRACALSYVVGLAFGAEPEFLIKNLKDYALWDFVTEKEKSLLKAPEILPEEENELSWIVEAIQALAWCLGVIDMDNFEGCSDELSSKFPMNEDPKNFIIGSSLRSISEIQEQCDFHYQLHWAAIHGQAMKISEALICERRRALDWVYGVERDWDDIPLDT